MTSTEPSSRERFLRAAATLLQERGYAATGMSDILAASGAPRGSLYFHFPGGKAELAALALEQAGAELCVLLQGILEGADTLPNGIDTLLTLLGQRLEASDFKHGCPVAPVVVECDVAPVRDAVLGSFRSWMDVIRDRLVREGFIAARAEELATFALSVVEGALLLAKAQRSTAPLARASAELTRLLAHEAPTRVAASHAAAKAPHASLSRSETKKVKKTSTTKRRSKP